MFMLCLMSSLALAQTDTATGTVTAGRFAWQAYDLNPGRL
jgi:hypothetical protein